MSRLRLFVIGAAVATVLSACSASAELRDGAPPTPQPAPAPQIVVIERPAPAAAEIPAGLIILAVLGIGMPACILAIAGGFAIGVTRERERARTAPPPPMQIVDARPERAFGRGRVHLLTDEEYRALVHQAQRARYLEAPHD